MESLLKTYVNNCEGIPLNQLIQLNDNLINSYLNAMSEYRKNNLIEYFKIEWDDKYQKLYDKLVGTKYKDDLKNIDEVISTLNDLSTDSNKNNYEIYQQISKLNISLNSLRNNHPGKLNEIAQKIVNSEFFYKIEDKPRKSIINMAILINCYSRLDLKSFEKHPVIIGSYIENAAGVDSLSKILTISDEYFNEHRNQLNSAFVLFRHFDWAFENTDNLIIRKKLAELYHFFKKWNLEVEGNYL